jgi:hypothetical protein
MEALGALVLMEQVEQMVEEAAGMEMAEMEDARFQEEAEEGEVMEVIKEAIIILEVQDFAQGMARIMDAMQ